MAKKRPGIDWKGRDLSMVHISGLDAKGNGIIGVSGVERVAIVRGYDGSNIRGYECSNIRGYES